MEIAKFLKDILFPVFCAECGREGEWWCEECLAEKKFSIFGFCPVCGKQSRGETCPGCREASSLDGVFSFLIYTENDPVGKLIKDFKYSFALDIKTVWGKIIPRAVGETKFCGENPWLLVPVPLHPRRERERGYNQARVIAEIIFSVLQKKYPTGQFIAGSRGLSRVRPTAQQARLSREERMKNVYGAFAWAGEPPERAILVDDVFTSGATMQECARVLKMAGTKKVLGLTLARAV
ncbi:MAG: ComF family protein [Patescibacteria group bacterium]|nr:ComF family protein [Patescibacteria group bacterium]